MSYSIQRVTSDGTLTDVVVGIQYMAQSDINVYVGGELASGLPYYAYVWVNSNTIRISPVVPVGIEVLLARATYIDEMLHDYEAGAIFNPKSMDENFTQLLYNVQESRERLDVTDVYNDINMHNHKVYNLAVATNDYDAIPYKQYKDDALGANAAADRAEAAANASAAANALATYVNTLEGAPNMNVWWKGGGGFKNVYLYSTTPGVIDASFLQDGNITGNLWTVPGGVSNLYNYLRYHGVGTLADTLEGALYPNATTLEANPTELNVASIIEKLSEVILNLKARVDTLEGELNGIRNPL